MQNDPLRSQSLAEHTAAVLVLIVLILYTYASFYEIPHAGFNFAADHVTRVYFPGDLQPGDELVKIDAVLMTDFKTDLRRTLFDSTAPGSLVPIVIRRGGQLVTIQWKFPGFNSEDFNAQIYSQWWLPFVFWLAGEIALLLLRPRNSRWRLIVAFNLLTAIWLSASNVSRWHVWESAVVLRLAMWLSIPVYLHLHWVFPKPLLRTPRLGWAVLYGVAALLAVAQWFQRVPVDLYQFGFLLAMAGSLLLLLAHYVFRPKDRGAIGLLLGAGTLALLPPIGLGLLAAWLGTAAPAALTALLFLPVLPFAYLYAAYRRQLGELEVRANQAIAIYFFLLLLGAVGIPLHAAATRWLTFPNAPLLVDWGTTGLAVLASIAGFARFQRFVERRVLNMPLPPLKLMETFAARVIVSLDEKTLTRLLTNEILPSLLIRQSALLRFDTDGLDMVYSDGLTADDLPDAGNIPSLLSLAGRYCSPDANSSEHRALAWVRLALTLSVGQKPLGLWLLGRRDPDDYYSQQDIAVLESLANQTAVALTNIAQAQLLRAFYKADIEQNDTQRTNLARELHDTVLNQLALLRNSMGDGPAFSRFDEICDSLGASIRRTIADLRPATTHYGLYFALTALADELSGRYRDGPAILLDLKDGEARYESPIEQHLYRIAQQACENALRHAYARTIKISGRLDADQVDLTVADDGIGFDVKEQLDLAGILAHRRFGLINMVERAALIGANIQIDSAPELGHGTQVQIHWAPGRR